MTDSRLLTRLRAAGAALCLALPLGLSAGPQADRAIAAVRQLVASGEVKPGTQLRLRVKQGNMASLLGRELELKLEWERATGLLLDPSVMPQVDSLELIRRDAGVDLTIARNHEYADLFHGGLIENLGPPLERFGFQPGENNPDIILPRQQAMVGSTVVAIPADLDTLMLYVRQDLLDDPRHRQQFQARYGKPLALPRTWADYQQQVEFFHRPAEGLFGTTEPRDKPSGWMTWMPRYLSTAAPHRWLFDDQMRPLINSPQGIAATEEYVATVAHSPPQILVDGNDYNYTLPIVMRGSAYSTMLTLVTAKLANRADSPVRGKLVAAPMPGRQVATQFARRTHLVYGNHFVVPRTSRHKAVALLFAMWLTDPDIAVRSVTANGLADPYRHSSLAHERVQAMYTPQALAVLRDELPVAAPSGTGLPGDSEYLGSLNQNLWLAASGQISAKEAMARTAREWEAITERHGRNRQIAHWRQFKTLYPGPPAAN